MKKEANRDEPTYSVVQALFVGFFNTSETVFNECFAGKDECDPDINCGECRLCKLQETVHHILDVTEKMGYGEEKRVGIVEKMLENHFDIDGIRTVVDDGTLEGLEPEEAAENIMEKARTQWKHEDSQGEVVEEVEEDGQEEIEEVEKDEEEDEESEEE